MNKDKPLLAFDVDGTLYQIPQSNITKSLLIQDVYKNLTRFIHERFTTKTTTVADILDKCNRTHGREFSTFFLEEYDVPLKEFFAITWDLDPGKVIEKPDFTLKRKLENLSKEYRLAIISDAPRVWVDKVVDYLDLSQVFSSEVIFTGCNAEKKTNKLLFSKALENLGDSETKIMIGDTYISDILHAKEFGFNTYYVGHLENLPENDTCDYIYGDVQSVIKNLQ